jgi:hypothetical protein
MRRRDEIIKFDWIRPLIESFMYYLLYFHHLLFLLEYAYVYVYMYVYVRECMRMCESCLNFYSPLAYLLFVDVEFIICMN